MMGRDHMAQFGMPRVDDGYTAQGGDQKKRGTSAMVMQAKWLDEGKSHLMWDKLLDGGIRWYVIKDTDLMFYVVENKSAIHPDLLEEYLKNEGKSNVKSRDSWMSDKEMNFDQNDTWLPEDSGIVNLSLKPSQPMDELRVQFQEIAEKAMSEKSIPDYIAELVKSSKGMYKMPSDETREQLNRIVHVQRMAQAYFDSQGIKILARFFVEDENTGTKYPGINSWAFLAKEDPDMSDVDIYRTASQHMKFGHDVGGKKGVLTNSPLVSTTEDLAKALMADSTFNTMIMMSLMASRSDTGDEKSVGGKYYSQRIDRLIYGHGNDQLNKVLMNTAPVANKIAFLAVNSRAKYMFTPGDVHGDQTDCCTLEGENALYAPNQDLMELALGILDNYLVKLKNDKKLK